MDRFRVLSRLEFTSMNQALRQRRINETNSTPKFLLAQPD
jgi:hypothetical protein